MRGKLFKKRNEKGQSAVEFLVLLPVMVYAIFITYQLFSIVSTSLINQAAARFELFHRIENSRGYALDPGIPDVGKPIYPSLESFNSRYRASIQGGTVSRVAAPPDPFFAMMVEEENGNFPERKLLVPGRGTVSIKTRYGICEQARGICR